MLFHFYERGFDTLPFSMDISFQPRHNWGWQISHQSTHPEVILHSTDLSASFALCFCCHWFSGGCGCAVPSMFRNRRLKPHGPLRFYDSILDCFVEVAATTSASNGCRWHASGQGVDSKIGSVQFQTHPMTRPAATWRAKPVPGPINPLVWRVCLDPLVSISGSVFQIFLFMVAFRYPTVSCKILTLVCHCLYLMNWLPL